MSLIGEFIVAHRDEISAACIARSEKLTSAQGLKREELVDSLPGLLSALGALLRDEDSSPLHRLLDLHLSTRLRQGFAVEEVVNEIILIGPCIFDTWTLH